MGSAGPSKTAYPLANHTRDDCGEMPVNLNGDSRNCDADSAFLNSLGYAQINKGSGPSLLASYPGGVYKVPLNSTPSSLLYLMISFGGSDNCGCGCGKFEILISFTGNTHGPSTRSFSNSSTMFKSPLSMLSAYLEFSLLL